MPTISLVVTERVISHVGSGRHGERQIAMRNPSSDIADAFSELSASNRRELVLGGCVSLAVGDTNAIWPSHNNDRAEDFEALYNLLARRPGQEMRFLCQLTE